MPLDRTEATLQVIELERETLANNPALESFLAQYATVVFYSEMEERISELITLWLARYSHHMISTFVSSSLKDIIKRTKKAEIVSFAERFGEPFKESFNRCMEEQKVTRYSNVITARHQAGHGRGSNITLAEVRLGLDGANAILDALSQCFEEHALPVNQEDAA